MNTLKIDSHIKQDCENLRAMYAALDAPANHALTDAPEYCGDFRFSLETLFIRGSFAARWAEPSQKADLQKAGVYRYYSFLFDGGETNYRQSFLDCCAESARKQADDYAAKYGDEVIREII